MTPIKLSLVSTYWFYFVTVDNVQASVPVATQIKTTPEHARQYTPLGFRSLVWVWFPINKKYQWVHLGTYPLSDSTALALRGGQVNVANV